MMMLFFVWLISLIAMIVYLIKGIWKKNRPLVKKKLLISTMIMIVSFFGIGLTSTETPEEPPQDTQVAKSVYRQAKTVEAEATQIKLKKIDENIVEITGKPVEQKQTEQSEQSVADAQTPAEPEKQSEAQPTQDPAPIETPPSAEEPVSIATAPEPTEEPPRVEKVSPAQEETKSAAYIGNSNTKKVHRASCGSVDTIKSQHIVEFYTLDAAKNSGYQPCKRCNPF